MRNPLVLLVMVIMFSACGQGPAGRDGTNGADGKDGSSCHTTPVYASSQAPNGGSMIECDDGSSSLVLNGTNGTNGVNGSNGANGTNGTNGTVIAPVQFCSGTTVYPSKFIEVGFCIDNELYAVYSANGGFLTHVPVGYYGSNGINASCNFTVAANCVIQ